MHWLNEIVILADSNRLGIGQGGLELTGEFVDSHVLFILCSCAW
jgi:hypothetical protein